MTGLIALVAALVVACVLGAAARRRAGRFSGKSTSFFRTVPADSPPPASAHGFLTPADLGAPLGQRATLVQFSTEFCAYCGPTRKLLGEVAASEPGVELVEIDAADRMDLTRRLNVFATPTVLVLGPDGAIVSRSSGQQRKAAVLEAVGAAAGDGAAMDGAGS